MAESKPVGRQSENSIREAALETGSLLTIIASEPGLAEQSLRATLESLPEVQVIGSAAGCLSALQMVGDRHAGLVVIDANIPFEEVQQFLRRLEEDGRETCVLVLAATTTQVYRALAAGADAALRRDASIRQVGAAIAELCQASPGNRQRSKDVALP